MKAIITLEIEIQENIESLYPNFIFNYEDKQDFLQQQIQSLNHNLLHGELLDNNGYRQIVRKVKYKSIK